MFVSDSFLTSNYGYISVIVFVNTHSERTRIKKRLQLENMKKHIILPAQTSDPTQATEPVFA